MTSYPKYEQLHLEGRGGRSYLSSCLRLSVLSHDFECHGVVFEEMVGEGVSHP